MPTAEEIAAAEKAATEDRNKQIATLAHSAAATHLKDLRPKLVEELKAALLAELAPTLSESVKTALAEHMKANPPPPPGKEPPGSDPAKPSPEFLALQKRFDDSEKLRKAQEERAEKAEKQRRDDSAIGAVRAGFAGTKVRPELVDMLTTAEWAKGRFKFDDKGQVLMTVRRAPMAGLEEVDQDLPLKDALDHWVRSKEAEPFLPPPRAAGPQQQQRAAGRVAPVGPTYDKPATSTAEKTARAMEREAALAERFPNLART
jgi:hypothetical protein